MTLYTYSLPRMYSDAEAADRLGISVATVRRLRVRGELGYLEIGRRVFVTEDQIKDLIRRGRRNAGVSVTDMVDESLPAKVALPSTAAQSRVTPQSENESDSLKRAYEEAEGGSIGPETAEIMEMFGVSQYLNSPAKPKRR
jgi:excisionase family DNA binding protein